MNQFIEVDVLLGKDALGPVIRKELINISEIASLPEPIEPTVEGDIQAINIQLKNGSLILVKGSYKEIKERLLNFSAFVSLNSIENTFEETGKTLAINLSELVKKKNFTCEKVKEVIERTMLGCKADERTKK